MPFVSIDAHDRAAVWTLADFYNEARRVDDPSAPPCDAEMLAGEMTYGWDLEPGERYFYCADGSAEPVGVLMLDMPRRDNRHVLWAEVTVRPELRRAGHGTVIMQEALRRAREAGRSTVWVGVPADDAGPSSFATRFGFRYASHEARRRQVLADVDQLAVDQLEKAALERASSYQLERLAPPYDDELLGALVEVSAVINDAPMGDLTWEPEHFDLARLRDQETARIGRGDRFYRVMARHVDTGEISGHTEVLVNPRRSWFGIQADTTVSRAHRGHRLGLLLKIEMMRWLAAAEPQLEVIETWNHVDNPYMISVNESLGYRLNRVFDTYELTLPT